MSKTLTVGDRSNVLNPGEVTFEEREEQLMAEEAARERAEKLAKDSPFSRWSQFNLEHTKELIWLAVKHPKAHAILYFLVDQMDQYNAVMCSYQVLQEVLGVGQATIARNIKVLKENGFITILKSGTSNVYAVNDTVYWKSWGKNKKYSKFPANVVLALSEQEEGYQEAFKDLGYDKLKNVTKKPTDRA